MKSDYAPWRPQTSGSGGLSCRPPRSHPQHPSHYRPVPSTSDRANLRKLHNTTEEASTVLSRPLLSGLSVDGTAASQASAMSDQIKGAFPLVALVTAGSHRASLLVIDRPNKRVTQACRPNRDARRKVLTHWPTGDSNRIKPSLTNKTTWSGRRNQLGRAVSSQLHRIRLQLPTWPALWTGCQQSTW